jgi:hypothetical protein
MKTRDGFVTNSSSSSFVVSKKGLSLLESWAIYNHIEVARNVAGIEESDEAAWEIEEDADSIRGFTYMDTFDMHWFLAEICGIRADSWENEK